MTRFSPFLLLLVGVSLLLCSGCLLEQPGPGGGDTAATRHAIMQQLLHAVTNATQDTLDAIDATNSDAAGALATTGISGQRADSMMRDLAVYHPAIMSAITLDPGGTVVAAAPDRAEALLGQNIADQEAIRTVISTQEPAMGGYFSLVQGGAGVALVHPVFSPGGEFLGMVSLAFSPCTLVAPVAEESMAYAPFIYNVVQTDGRILYHADPALVGRQTFNETTFAGFPEILDLARRYSTNRSGYATFSFYHTGTGKIVQKETFWDTVGLHGTEWRVLVVGETR